MASDDMPLPGYFARAMRIANSYPDTGLICGKMKVVHEVTGRVSIVGVDCWDKDQYVNPKRFLNEYLYNAAPNHSLGAGTLWRRDALEEIGGFDESLLSWCDTFAARSIALKYGISYINSAVVQVGYSDTCYSARVSRELSTMLAIINRAAARMRSDEYRDRFPADYVLRWKRDYLLMLQKIQGKSASQGAGDRDG
jgi:hypothetical protein